VEDIREFIMTEIEPVGVASRNLEEFIKVQLQEMYPKQVEFHERMLNAIKTGKLDEDVKEAISHLRLKPIEGEGSASAMAKVDLLLEHDGENWYIFIQEDFLDLQIEEDAHPQDDIEKEKFRRAKNIKLILDIRRKVLRHIGQAIVKRQEGFLLRDEPLKTLTVKEVAESSQVSMSTVSRIINSRYAKTPAGTYPLRFFFVKESKRGMSKEELMRAIKEVLQENTSISDSKVAHILKGRGIDIARRTVAKYRKLLGLR
jgi:RNA polymerase sigma-54 factor